MIQLHSVLNRARELLQASGLTQDLTSGEIALATALVEHTNRVGANLTKTKPTIEEVVQHNRAQRDPLPTDQVYRFYNYYESNGWKVGKNPMRNWKAALANWKRNYEERNPGLKFAV